MGRRELRQYLETGKDEIKIQRIIYKNERANLKTYERRKRKEKREYVYKDEEKKRHSIVDISQPRHGECIVGVSPEVCGGDGTPSSQDICFSALFSKTP